MSGVTMIADLHGDDDKTPLENTVKEPVKEPVKETKEFDESKPLALFDTFRDYNLKDMEDKYVNILNSCKCLNTRTFKKDLEEVKATVVNKNTPNKLKLILGEWMFKKIYIYCKMRNENITDVTTSITQATKETINIVLKGLYIQYHNIDALRKIAECFFFDRFDEEYFILQMLNDVQLIQTTPYDDILSHFVKWIKRSDTLEQQSNLLDVLLRYFSHEKEVKEIYRKMRFGVKDKTVVNLYNDDQNAHDKDITAATMVCAHKLLKWRKDHQYVDEKAEFKPREEWIEESEFVFDKLKGIKHSEEIITRAKIDNTVFQEFTIMDLLLATVRYMFESPRASELFNRLEEEFIEMNGLCSSGYITRFINAFHGLDEEFTTVLPFKKQLQSVVCNKMVHAFQSASPEQVSGSYSDENKEDYLELVEFTINDSLPQMFIDYGKDDVEKEIKEVLVGLTGWDKWIYQNERVSYS